MSVYIVGAKRTPIGSFLGSLQAVTAPELASVAFKAALKESRVDLAHIDEVILGNVLSSGQKQGVARQAAIYGDIPLEVPAYAVNMVCGSGMKAAMNGYSQIKAGLADLIVAGGVESMSQAPFLVSSKVRQGNKMGNLSMTDTILHDALLDSFDGKHMGVTAENIAEKYQITREAQDEFALSSQEKAIAALDSGVFTAELVPVEVKSRRGTQVISEDEYPNRQTNQEKLAKLRAAFLPEGTVTVGNASGLNDGASALVLASENYVKEHQLTPLVEVVGIGQGGVEPSLMGLGPTPAIKQALQQAGLTLADIDVIELNEAFAAQSLGVIRELADFSGLSESELQAKTNLHGGAIALGHPLGASGNRIIVTLLHIMRKKNYQYGLASLCIGGGMGVAVILKNIE